MKSILCIVTILCFTTSIIQAQCTETDETKILLVGDSWANFIGADQVINTAFEKWGHSNYKFLTNAILAENGMQTINFLQPVKLNEIAAQLNANPSIKIVHLSIGGNDVLSNWNKNWSASKTDSLLDSVYIRLVAIIDFIKINKPGVKILWSGYAYPNFGEIINELAPFQTTHPFYATWAGMGSPTFTELNSILNYFSDTITALAAADPQVSFVKATGLMQYSYGQQVNLGVPPSGTYLPFTAPMPDGYPDYPSPKLSMRTYLIFRDCFHLSPAGYEVLLDYQTQKYYHKALMDDQYFLSEGGTRDGSVSAQGTVTTALQLGEIAQEEFSTLLSFNTTTMPDTGVSKASLFLRRQSLTGNNPVGNTLQVKIANGNFGATVDVEATDYSASGNATDDPCRFGSITEDGHWLRLDLPTTLLPYITHLNTTQFLISSQAATGGLVTFSDATDPEFAPVLNVTYGPSFTGIINSQELTTVKVYPNPTNGPLVIDAGTAKISKIEITDMLGKIILTNVLPVSGTIDISSLNTGIYSLKIITGTTSNTQKIIKR